MQNRWINMEEASKLAEKSVRTIWHWAKKYGLTKRSSGNHTLLDAVEVNSIIDAGEREFAPTPQLLSVLAARLAKVEAELEVLSYTAGRYQPIDTTPNEARSLYETVVILSEGEVPADMVEEAVGFLNGVSEEMIDQLLEQDIMHPWVPFFTLAANLQAHLRNSHDFSTNLEKQSLYRRLSISRERLRGIALIYIEMDLDSNARKRLTEYVGDAPLLEAELRRRLFWKKDPPRTRKEIKPVGSLIEEALALYQEDGTLSAKKKAVRLLRDAVRSIENEKIDIVLG